MPPRIMNPLQNKEAMEGSSARLDCVIVGQPEPEVGVGVNELEWVRVDVNELEWVCVGVNELD